MKKAPRDSGEVFLEAEKVQAGKMHPSAGALVSRLRAGSLTSEGLGAKLGIIPSERG
jgi:hypothetical protein